MKPQIGIIGGSGLYHMPGFEAHEERALETPFGAPSDAYIVGSLAGKEVAFLVAARPGAPALPVGAALPRQHLRLQEARRGAHPVAERRRVAQGGAPAARLRDPRSVRRSHERTASRLSSAKGWWRTSRFADPICPQLAEVAHACCKQDGINAKLGGTYLCMEGPAFSTKAESNLYRSWGMDVIGMTNLQEAKLAREAEICYATVAMVTDYDCWHPDHDAVTVSEIIGNLMKNAENAARLVKAAVAAMPAERTCKCGSALAHALITDKKAVPPATLAKLELIVGKYFRG